MEFGVFGVLMTSLPFCRATLLLIERVRFRISKSSHRNASNSPRRKPVVSSRYIGARMPCSFAALRYGRSTLQAEFSFPCACSLGFCISLLDSQGSIFPPLRVPAPYSAPHGRIVPRGAQPVFFQLRLVLLLHTAAFEQLIVKLLDLQHRQLFQLHISELRNDVMVDGIVI